jgi:hypothetical protein
MKTIILVILIGMIAGMCFAGLIDMGIGVGAGPDKLENYMLLEDEVSFLLLESGDKLILEQI